MRSLMEGQKITYTVEQGREGKSSAVDLQSA
jgi:cold shock CspA family protein